jgi:hypothetical protein
VCEIVSCSKLFVCGCCVGRCAGTTFSVDGTAVVPPHQHRLSQIYSKKNSLGCLKRHPNLAKSRQISANLIHDLIHEEEMCSTPASRRAHIEWLMYGLVHGQAAVSSLAASAPTASMRCATHRRSSGSLSC